MIRTQSETHSNLGVRPKHSSTVWFAFGDASGKAFGVSLWVTGTEGINVCYGTWYLVLQVERAEDEGK
jgi:hypothetical protein